MLLGPGIRNPSAAEVENRFARRSAVFRLAESMETIDPLSADETTRVPGPGLRWVGIQDTYFLVAAVPVVGLEQVVIQPILVTDGPDGAFFEPWPATGELSDAQQEAGRELGVVLASEGEQLSLVAYWGPKQYGEGIG